MAKRMEKNYSPAKNNGAQRDYLTAFQSIVIFSRSFLYILLKYLSFEIETVKISVINNQKRFINYTGFKVKKDKFEQTFNNQLKQGRSLFKNFEIESPSLGD